MSVHVFPTMGTMVSLRAPDGALDADTLRLVEGTFRRYDRQFSLYDADSPLSLIAAGRATLAAADQEVRDAYALAVEWRNRTGGSFTPHRPDGVVDLSGVVKALAIRDAGDHLDTASGDWLLAVGGDVLGRGRHETDPWCVGVIDPHSRDCLVGVAELHEGRRAVATSGTAERGEHIWRREGSDIVQATVAARDIVTADVLATALIAGDALERVVAEHDVDALVIRRDGSSRASESARTWIDH